VSSVTTGCAEQEVWRVRRNSQRADAGQAMVAVVVTAAAIAMVATVALGRLGGDAVSASRARAAADAAALAAVSGGEQAARELVARNGATLVSWVRTGDEVIVTVRVGDALASARATDRQ
jgi:hypothetical protein